MSDGTLAARLDALANENPSFEDGARVIPAHDVFDAVLTEIDQTVLPATLQFTSGDAALSLVVAGRRLCAVINVANTLAPDDTAAITAAAEAIADFAEKASGSLLLRDSEAPDDLGDASHRVSGATLAQAAGRVVIDPNAPFLEKLRLRLGPVAQASILFDGQTISDGQGPKPLREILNKAAKAQLGAFVEKRATQCPSHGEPSLTVLAGSVGDGLAIGLASTDTEHLLMVMADEDIAAASQAFHLSI